MYALRRFRDEEVRSALADLAGGPVDYPQQGVTKEGHVPAGYHKHHRRVRLGQGREVFERACAAVDTWKMFDMPWVTLWWTDAPVELEQQVAVMSGLFGVWSLNPCRIIYLIDDTQGSVRRHGFGYGTLPGHVMSGEERFMVTWDQSDDSVWYDLLAFSKPSGLLAHLALPVIRAMQWRFGTHSLKAMARHANPS